MKQKKRILIIAPLFVIFLIVWTVWGNITVGVTHITFHDKDVPASFDGYKIVQVSDLHNAEFGNENENLIHLIRQEKPDIIVFTGDLVDSNHTDIDTAINFAKNISDIAPCYFVTGNHEAWLSNDAYQSLERGLLDAGVRVLRNQYETISKNDERIVIAGIDDPNFVQTASYSGANHITIDKVIGELNLPDHNFVLLLSHRPEEFTNYTNLGIDLVLTGHAHGGQFRLPFIGGIVAPNQGLFPKYDAGLYSEGETTMFVSRGLGNSIIPIRLNNRPELVVITIHKE